MFRRLLLRLTLLNASVIAILFLTLIVGAYFYAQYEINRHSLFVLTRITKEINSGHPPPFLRIKDPNSPGNMKPPDSAFPADRPVPPPPGGPPVLAELAGPQPPPPPDDFRGPKPVIFYAQTDPAGKIDFSSPQQQLNDAQLKELVASVPAHWAPHGRLNFANTMYFYLASPRADQAGTLIVFQNFEQEYLVFQTIMKSLAVIGVLCLVISLGGSLFLARRAMRPIQQAWDRQRDFLADASHELRTPLAVIQASLDVIRSNADEQVFEQKQWLDNMGESLTSMANLVESLLFLARIDSSQHPMEKKAFALDKAIANAVELFRPLADAKGIQIFLAVDSNITMAGDEARIKQVVGIILDNAIRHTPAGGKIEILLQQIQRNAQLTVTDTGEGIPPEHLAKIFERFYQVDPARNKDGSGLGLSIAKCIVESHRGTIQALSKPRSGTTFLIRLPLPKSTA